MMTVVAIMASLLPIMWSIGTGSEVMQRIAMLVAVKEPQRQPGCGKSAIRSGATARVT
jgi:hypothetical protein